MDDVATTCRDMFYNLYGAIPAIGARAFRQTI